MVGNFRHPLPAGAEGPLQGGAVRAHVDGREIVKEIVVPGKLVNLVVR